MLALIETLQGPIGSRLVAVLLHTLWQAAALALVAGMALRIVPAARAELRYRIVLGALAFVVISPFLTWSCLGPAWNGAREAAAAVVNSSSHETALHGRGGHAHVESGKTPSVPVHSVAGRTESGRWAAVPTWVVPALLAAWLSGAIMMLARTAAHLHAARQLQTGTPATDAPLLLLVDEVGRRLGLRRAVRVLVLPDLASPVICGVWTPALIVPLSFLTGLTPDQQFAVIAHELAHVRRGDFLVNLLQLVVESILFFNPAVLWLSRQVRIEREACCDAIAVSLTDAPIEYVRTLADWAERMMSPAPQLAPAFAEPAEGGALGDRVRRVLAPTRAPNLRVRWGTFAGLLAAVAVAVVLIAKATDWAVTQAAKALTDAERIKVVAEARKEVPVEDDADLKNGEPVRVKARIRTWDGKPVSGFHVSLHSQSRNSGYGSSMTINPDGKLDTEIDGGRLKGAIGAPGYASVLFPERRAPGGTEVDYGEVVLPAGRPARVRFVDPLGKPVRADRISAAPAEQGSRPIQNLQADENGEVLLQNIIDVEYQVSARASGYQPVYDWKGRLPENVTTTVTMQPSKVTTGVIQDRDGTPVPGVQIFVNQENSSGDNSGHSYGHGFPGQLWTTSGPDGSFRIDQMADKGRADFVLMQEGVPRALIQDVESGQTGLVWTLDPAITIRGRFEGDLNLINKVPRYRSVFFSIYRPDRNGHRQQVLGTSFPVKEDGSFEIKGLVTGTFQVERDVAPWKQELTGPLEDVVIPLKEPRTSSSPSVRPLTLLFSHQGQTVQPGGRVIVESSLTRQSRKPYDVTSRETAVEIASTGPVTIDGSQLLGFTLEKSMREQFRAEELGDTLALPVLPAGAIRGTVLDDAGKPLAGAKVRILITGFQGFPPVPEEMSTGALGEFLMNPVLLRQTASVLAAFEHARAISEPIELDSANPSQTVTIRMPRRTSVRVRVIDDEGRPLAGIPLTVEVTVRNAKTSSGGGLGVVARTDSDGMATIEGLGDNLADYILHAPAKGPWVHQVHRFTSGGTTEVRLRRGQTLSGVVLDDTGAPLPGVTVLANLVDMTPGSAMSTVFEPEDTTDAEGRFRFSNLPDLPVRLNPVGMTVPPAKSETPVRPGGPDVTIQGTPAKWLLEAIERARGKK